MGGNGADFGLASRKPLAQEEGGFCPALRLWPGGDTHAVDGQP